MRARRAKRNPLLPVGGADESLAGCLHYRDGSRWASEDRRLRGLSAACSDTGPREPRLSDRYSRPSACVAMRNWSWVDQRRGEAEVRASAPLFFFFNKKEPPDISPLSQRAPFPN